VVVVVELKLVSVELDPGAIVVVVTTAAAAAVDVVASSRYSGQRFPAPA
jgi:hypothetical protein